MYMINKLTVYRYKHYATLVVYYQWFAYSSYWHWSV